MKCWEAETGKERFTIRTFKGYRDIDFEPNGGVAISPDGKTLALEGSDDTVRLWDMATGKPKAALGMPDGRGKHSLHTQALAYSPDGRLIVCGYLGG